MRGPSRAGLRILAPAVVLALLALIAWRILGPGEGGGDPPSPEAGPQAEAGTGAGAASPQTGGAPGADLRRDLGEPAPRSELPGGAELRQGFVGRILDQNGTPVAGALVYLLEAHQQDVFTSLLLRARGLSVPPVARGTSAADGSFQVGIRRVASGGYEVHILGAQHPDHVLPKLTAFAGRFVDLGEVRLPPGQVLTGQVTVQGSAGFPIPDAEIVVQPAGLVPAFGTAPGREDGIRTTTGPNGVFRLPHLAPGFVRITAVAQGFARVERQAVEIRAGVENRVDFELPKGLSIAGEVRDEAGVGIAGARVEATLLSSREPFVAQARADADGRFDVLGLIEGPYRLDAAAPGFVGDSQKPVRAGATEARFTLRRQGSLALRVRGAGRDLRQYEVLLRGHDAENDRLRPLPWAQLERVLGDDLGADGSFRLRHVDPGSYVVQVDAPGYARTFSAPCAVGVDTQDVPVLVDMRQGGTLVGRCLGPDGQPLAEVEVRTLADSLDDSPLLAMLGDALPTRITTTGVRSGANGRFELPLLAAGAYQLRLEHPAFAPLALRGLELVDGEHRDLGEFRLVRGAELLGTVRVDGAPAGQVKISATQLAGDAGGFQASAVSDDQGRFRFDRRLAPGRYQVQAARQTLPNPILQVMDYQKTRQEFVIAPGQESQQIHFTLSGG
jgi:protocatechuate 3,4-dioxygenase beta subunit